MNLKFFLIQLEFLREKKKKNTESPIRSKHVKKYPTVIILK